MADWVDSFKPYQSVESCELRMGTVLRRVPFPVSALGSNAFGVKASDGQPQSLPLDAIALETEVVRTEKVTISPGVVITPECDIFQHKCNRVVLAQLVTVDNHIINQNLAPGKSRALREEIDRARQSNPGAFNRAGLFLMLRDNEFGFFDHVILMENQVSLPIEFAEGQDKGVLVTESSVGGFANIWFRIGDPLLKSRLTAEIARHFLRIGLEDAS
jgi:hypothetical protein